MSIYKKILKLIKEYDEIVIAHHIGPDPDAVASSVALKEIININFPNKKVYAVGTNVSRFKYLGILDKIDETQLENALLIILDVPKFDRVDSAYKPRYKATVKIDHHPCDEDVADIDLIELVSSTCEIITKFAYINKLKMNDNIARTLYAGIVADSDRFLLSYTTPETLIYASKLLNDYNLDLTNLYDNLYERPISERKFESYIIENLTITENGFGYINITNDAIKKFGVDSGTASNMVNDLNFIKELKVWAFSSFDEKLGIYKINIRSRKITINEVASKYNGGGHKFASGARLKTQEEVDNLFKDLDLECKKYNECKE